MSLLFAYCNQHEYNRCAVIEQLSHNLNIQHYDYLTVNVKKVYLSN